MNTINTSIEYDDMRIGATCHPFPHAPAGRRLPASFTELIKIIKQLLPGA